MLGVVVAHAISGCVGWPDSAPQSDVVVDNNYPASSRDALVVYDAYWLNVSFAGHPILPGASSDPQSAVPTSGNVAYVVLAPGWDPSRTAPPSSFILVQSRSTYALALGDTLHILVDDNSFQGNCGAGSPLTQDQADFLTRIVFASDFAGLAYDSSTCATTPVGDGAARGESGAD